jgi:hypothetical protein
VEDSYLNMRKKNGTVENGKSETTLKPRVQGKFSLRPTTLYLN